jgi:putative toxin-antitoxin system antitoxin component (TIGR02293 family)
MSGKTKVSGVAALRQMTCYIRHMARALLQATTQKRIHAIKEGLSYQVFESLTKDLELPASELAQIIGVPVRTLQRRKQEGFFPSVESDRLFRLVRLVERSKEVLGKEGISWLTTPKKFLDGQTPLNFSDTEAGAWEVTQALGRLEHGVFL